MKKEIVDVVCGMNLSEYADIEEVLHRETIFYFCSKGCEARFRKDPEKFQKEPLIRLVNVWKTFNAGEAQTQALGGLDLNVWEGDFVSIIGASGSGKSTALNMVGLLDRPTSGKIYIKGKDVSLLSDEERARLRSIFFGFVFQQYNLIPWLTALENITLPVVFSGKNVNERKLSEYIKDAGLEKRILHRPFELSGGEQQRTALLRALINDPQVIIGDEPTGNLDSTTGNKILAMLIDLNKVERRTLVIVTHDADIAEKADQVVVLKDGRVVRDHAVHRKAYTEAGLKSH